MDMSLISRLFSFHWGSVFRNPNKIQEKVLLDILFNNTTSAYGQRFGFGDIKSVQDFQASLPIVDYSLITSYIERIKNGEQNVLTTDSVIYFATTSGTTNKPKFIPVTERRVSDFMFENILWVLLALKYNKKFFGGKMLYFAGAKSEGKTTGGVPFGSISGFIANRQKERFAKRIAVGEEVFDCKSFNEKMKTYYKQSLPQDVRQISFAYPTELLLFVKYIAERKNSEINLSELWPNLSLVGCFKKALDDYPIQQIIGLDTLVIDHGIRASEGTISIGCNPSGRSGIPAIQQTFLEFREVNTENTPIFVHQLKEGIFYEVIMTTPYGLYRYSIGDIIQVSGWVKNLPLIEFVSRNKTLDTVGEHVPYSQIESAVRDAESKSGIELIDYTLIPNKENVKPTYDLFVEIKKGDNESLQRFLSFFEKFLQEKVLSYERMRNYFNRLGEPRLLTVKKGEYNELNKRRIMGESQPKSKHVAEDSKFQRQLSVEQIITL